MRSTAPALFAKSLMIYFAICTSFLHKRSQLTMRGAPVQPVQCPSQTTWHYYWPGKCTLAPVSVWPPCQASLWPFQSLAHLGSYKTREGIPLHQRGVWAFKWTQTSAWHAKRMKLSHLMTTVALAFFTAVNILKKERKTWKQKVVNNERVRSKVMWRTVENPCWEGMWK